MPGSLVSIAYHVSNAPVELIGVRDWTRAIQRQRLRRDTMVTVYRDGMPARIEMADNVPELHALFDEIDPPLVVREPEPPAAVPAVEAEIQDAPFWTGEPESESASTSPVDEGDDTEAQVANGRAPFTGPTVPEVNWRPLAIGAAVVGVLIIGSVASRSRPDLSYPTPQPANVAAYPLEIAADANAAMPVDNGVANDAAAVSNEVIDNYSMDMNAVAPMNVVDSGNETASNMTSGADAPTVRPLYVINSCHYHLDVWTYYKSPDSGWRVVGPRSLRTDQSVDLRTDNRDVYVYAEAPGTGMRWATAGHTRYLGVSSMIRANVNLNSAGSYYVSLTCS